VLSSTIFFVAVSTAADPALADSAPGDCLRDLLLDNAKCTDEYLDSAIGCIPAPFCVTAATEELMRCNGEARHKWFECNAQDVPEIVRRHLTGDIYHNISRTVVYGGGDRHHAWTDHDHSVPMTTRAVLCASDPTCLNPDVPHYEWCSDYAVATHVHCDMWRDEAAHGSHYSWIDMSGCPSPPALCFNGTPCPEEAFLVTDRPWPKIPDGHGMCNHDMYEPTLDQSG
jgi:hypothetical protein